ncbi:hypothetical protein V2J09_011224 [Rumex salicifolius]
MDGWVGRVVKDKHGLRIYRERLVALEECCNLGQGFQLAERDMSIRGFGNIFGEQQTGDIGNVEEHRIVSIPSNQVQLDLNINPHFSPDYVNYLDNPMETIKNAEEAAEKDMLSLMEFTEHLRT